MRRTDTDATRGPASTAKIRTADGRGMIEKPSPPEDSMRPIRYVCLTLLLFVPSIAYAGQIYGTIVLSGKGVKAKLEIKCGDDATAGESAADGSYRVNVAQQGQCTLTLPEYKGSSSAIFSGPNPTAYNFELVARPDGTYELKRR